MVCEDETNEKMFEASYCNTLLSPLIPTGSLLQHCWLPRGEFSNYKAHSTSSQPQHYNHLPHTAQPATQLRLGKDGTPSWNQHLHLSVVTMLGLSTVDIESVFSEWNLVSVHLHSASITVEAF